MPMRTWRVSGGSGYGCEGWVPGQVVRNREGTPEWLVVEDASKSYVGSDGLSFGVGDEAGWCYSATLREATDTESAPWSEALAQKLLRIEARRRLSRTFDRIVRDGSRPRGGATPVGENLELSPRTLHDMSKSIILGPDWIWAVRAGYPSATAVRIPYSARLAANLRRDAAVPEPDTILDNLQVVEGLQENRT